MFRHASANRAYTLVWNEATASYVPAPEGSRRRGKQGRSAVAVAAAALLAGAGGAHAVEPGALPSGGRVSSGQATITQNGNSAVIRQDSARAAIDWNRFVIGSDARVQFVQPSASSVVLNRVLGQDPTQIFGRLDANGQVFISNPNGVLFAPGAQVNAAGVLATTLGISNDDFAAGRFRFSGTSKATVENQGQVTAAAGGYVALVGAQVTNSGSIDAPRGDVHLAAADGATLRLDGQHLAGFSVTQGTLDALVANKGLIRADGGQVFLTADGVDQLARSMVNNAGVVEAASVGVDGSRIVLQGDIVENLGTLAASGGSVQATGHSLLQAGTVRADGGSVLLIARDALLHTEGASTAANAGGSVRIDGGRSTWISGTVQADGERGGSVAITGQSTTLSGATLSADGTRAGGSVQVGGGVQGASLARAGDATGSFANAKTTQVNNTTTLSAQGAGGKLVVWSDETTRYAGDAKTGAAGFIEISGKGDLLYQGRANPGQGGNLLLDPTNITIGNSFGAATDYITLADPNPAANDYHGYGGVKVLPSGNIVVASPQDSFGGAGAGAVYLYNGTTGALISALYGSSGEYVGGYGSNGVTVLSNGNYVVASSQWKNGSNANAGAVTWGSATTGINGRISASNSLVGSKAGDSVGGYGITTLSNGNYVVRSPNWNNGSNTYAGAVTWGNGATGTSGVVSADNSLVGTNANDYVGNSGVLALTNGNYVVLSQSWRNGSNANAGAATWGNGSTGITGVVSSANSLVGTNAGDNVGNSGAAALTNGNYVVRSSNWKNGANASAGAVTWGDGTTGIKGTVSTSNSLVGSNANDYVGNGGITALSDGDYVVSSYSWKNGSAANAGAVTWGSGTAGVKGAVSASNSLVGSTASDTVGSGGNGSVKALDNGNYVVLSPNWDNGSLVNAGAVTWGNGDGSTRGTITAANSLVGGNASDYVGSGGVYVLSNGNYVVASPNWKNGSLANAGAATWASGTTGVKGLITTSNSLVGTHTNDQVGIGSVYGGYNNAIVALNNGNYVVTSSNWNGSVGAVTWGNGATGTTGAVTASNSLVGSSAGDYVGSGGVYALTNGNYVVSSTMWKNGSASSAGAVTWGNGTTGITGTVSISNSLVGTTANDGIGGNSSYGGYGYCYDGNNGCGGVIPLTNGNYVITSANWNNGSATRAGAVTFGNGTTGITGAVSASNSLVGTKTNDRVGAAGYDNYMMGGSQRGVTPLPNGNYVVTSTNWSNDASNSMVGAVTWGNGTTGVSGPVSSSNSLVGKYSYDSVGGERSGYNNMQGVMPVGTDRYVIRSPFWRNGNLAYAGSVVLADATRPVTGVLEEQLTGPAAGQYTPAQVAQLAVAGTTTTLQASNNITVDAAVTVAGALKLEAGNTVTLNASLTSTATGNALVLSGQKFVNNAGANPLNTPNGRWLVWSANPADDVRGGLVHDFKQYNATYGTSSVLGSGNGLLYSVAPTLTASLTGAVTKTYNASSVATLGAGNLAVSGTIDGDSATLAATGATYADANAGSGKIVTATGVNVASASNGSVQVYGYRLASTSVNGAVGSIARALLNVSATALDKVYDGSAVATLSGTTLTGLINGQTLVLNNTGATFTDKNAGSGKTVTVAGLSLANGTGLASNYQLAGTSVTTSATITPKTLTLTGLSATDKVYDGTTAALFSGTAGLSGVVAVDAGKVAVAGSATGTFSSKNAGSNKAVALSGLGLGAGGSGDESANYTLAVGGYSASITPKTINVGGDNSVSKVYDGSTAMTSGVSGFVQAGTVAAGAGNANDGFAISGDAIGYSGAAQFAGKDAGSRAVVRGTVALTGTDAGNYTLQWTNGAGTITPASLTMTANDSAKVLTGTDPTLSARYSGFVAGEDASVLSGVTVTRAAGESAGTYVITPGASAGNYTITPVNGTFTVEPADRLLIQLGNQSVTYGGALPTLAAPTATYYSSAGTTIESITLTHGGGNVWTGTDSAGGSVSITLTTTASAGSGVGNYAVSAGAPQTSGSVNFSSHSISDGHLTVKPLQVNVATAGTASKVYDGSTALSGLTLSVGNKVGSDDVGLAYLASYDSRNAGTGLGYTISDIQLSGSTAGNYYLASSSLTGNTGVITPKAVSASGATGVGKVYDRTTTLPTGTAGHSFDVAQIVAGDTLTLSGSTAFGGVNAGAQSIVQGNLALAGADAGNYTLGFTNGSGSIAQKVLQVVGSNGVTRSYDGTTALPSAGYSFATNQVISGDTLHITGAAAFDSKNAGTRSVVQGTLAFDNANYSLSFVNGSGSIAQATLSFSGVVVADKVYDGTRNATVTGFGNLVGRFGNDVVVPDSAAALALFDSKDAGQGKTVTVGNLSLAGADAGNYVLQGSGGSATTTANVTPKAITVSANVADKVYDGTTSASAQLASSGVLISDGVVFSGSASFADRNAGQGKTVSIGSITATGADAGNYTFNTSASTQATIKQRTIVVSATAADKVYDGSTAASATLASTEVLTGDTVSFNGSASFADKTAGSNKSVTVSAITTSGTDGANYAIAGNAMATATITPKAITVVATGIDKTYDGIVDATVALGSSGVVAGDKVSFSGTATFADKHAGAGKTVTVTNITHGDDDAANYSIHNGTSTTATITPKAITVAATGIDKVYDGSIAASVALASSGLIAGDLVRFSGTALFADKQAGAGKAVSVAGITAAGADAANYSINTTGSTTATITPKAITVAAAGIDKVYDGSSAASVTLASGGLFGGDVVSFSGSAAFADKHAGAGKSVSVDGIAAAGADAANYSINTSATTTASITPKAITVAASGIDKVYDGSRNAAVTLGSTGLITGDVVAFSGDALFADRHAAVGKAVSVSGIAASGADAANYSINTSASTTASITPKAITVAASGIDKVYDGSSNAGVTLASGGIVAGDSVSFSGSASFADKHAGSGKSVSVAGITTAGADAGNYSINTTAGTHASITPKAITVTATASDKVYDGQTAATAQLASDGIVAGDGVSFSGSARFADANAGQGKTITVSGLTAAGADAANYSLVSNSATTLATVTQRALQVQLTGLVGKVQDGQLGATLGSTNYLLSGLVDGESLTVTQTGGVYDTVQVGKAKTVTVTLGAGDYAAGATTRAANYALVTGPVSAAVGEVTVAIDATALAASISSIPSLPSGASVVSGFATTTPGASATPAPAKEAEAEKTEAATPRETSRPAVAPAADGRALPSRVVRIGGAGMRLPDGVKDE